MTENADVIAQKNEQLASFVGKKYESYYQQKWALAGQIQGFNIAAFFLGGFWFVYRKMYFYSMAITIFSLTIKYILMMPNLPKLIYIFLILILLGISVVLGLLSNNLYKKFSEEKIKLIESTHLVGEVQEQIKRKGGTDLLGVFIYLIVVMLVNFIFRGY